MNDKNVYNMEEKQIWKKFFERYYNQCPEIMDGFDDNHKEAILHRIMITDKACRILYSTGFIRDILLKYEFISGWGVNVGQGCFESNSITLYCRNWKKYEGIKIPKKYEGIKVKCEWDNHRKIELL